MENLNTVQKEDRLNYIVPEDEISCGGAYHQYRIVREADDTTVQVIRFQKGPRNQTGSVPGVTESDLLEIVRNRLENFQNGDHPCRENEAALEYVEEALMWLNRRTEERRCRGVLGSSED